MSAFVVETQTIDRIVSYLLATYDTVLGVRTDEPGAGDRIGRELLALNVAAVNCRYDEHEPVPEYRYTPRRAVGRVRAYKSIQCLLYQCSEGEEFAADPAYVALEAAADRLAHAIVCDLPEYERSDWS